MHIQWLSMAVTVFVALEVSVCVAMQLLSGSSVVYQCSTNTTELARCVSVVCGHQSLCTCLTVCEIVTMSTCQRVLLSWHNNSHCRLPLSRWVYQVIVGDHY